MTDLHHGNETQNDPILIVGYCTACKKMIKQTDQYTVVNDGRGIRCAACELREKRLSLLQEIKMKKISLIVGAAVGVAVLAGLLAILLSRMDSLILTLLISLVCGLAAFTFTAQLFWSDFLQGIFLFFFKTFRFPGLIFTLDLEGIVWFICVKLLFAILGFVLSSLIFLFGLAFSMAVSLVSFPFTFIAYSSELKEEAERLNSSIQKEI